MIKSIYKSSLHEQASSLVDSQRYRQFQFQKPRQFLTGIKPWCSQVSFSFLSSLPGYSKCCKEPVKCASTAGLPIKRLQLLLTYPGWQVHLKHCLPTEPTEGHSMLISIVLWSYARSDKKRIKSWADSAQLVGCGALWGCHHSAPLLNARDAGWGSCQSRSMSDHTTAHHTKCAMHGSCKFGMGIVCTMRNQLQFSAMKCANCWVRGLACSAYECCCHKTLLYLCSISCSWQLLALLAYLTPHWSVSSCSLQNMLLWTRTARYCQTVCMAQSLYIFHCPLDFQVLKRGESRPLIFCRTHE